MYKEVEGEIPFEIEVRKKYTICFRTNGNRK